MTEKNWKEFYEKECEKTRALRSANNAHINQSARQLERIRELIAERDALQAIINSPDSAYANLRNNHEILQRALEVVYHVTRTALAAQEPPK